MDPKIWGRPYWFVLHIASLTYPENPTNEDKINYSNFIRSVSHVLPCASCQYHFKEYIRNYPIENYLDSKNNFIEWLIIAHNNVNRKNGKRQFSREEVEKLYSHVISSTKNVEKYFIYDNKNYYLRNEMKIIINLCILIIICFVYYYVFIYLKRK